MSVNTMPSTPLAGRITDPILLEVLSRYTKTSPETVDDLLAACIENDLPKFRARFDDWASSGYDVHELADVMREAVCRNNVEIVSMLLSHGQSPEASYATDAVRHRAKDVLAVFLQNGWDINGCPAQGRPPVLGLAVHDEDMATWLLDRGADPNQQSLIDLTPTSVAVKEAPLSTIKLFFDRGADVNKGQLLHHAVERDSGEAGVVAFLLEKGAAINAKMYENHPVSFGLYCMMGIGTPLHFAAQAGKYGLVQYLLEKGADPTIKDALDKTAMDWARFSGHADVMGLLKIAMDKDGATAEARDV
ncbi:ankyrin repeat domain-containing protein [Aspergillus mulundensis]|uniref:Ankyrin repeat protein n=1 Tax=Aspergillus mulundensis TaxID=1810919 RepID=A0A3D8QW32_9EURO|nr:Ankyrin repeat protein [Aspergillus mulundensis]RDW65724.1 Ankyrin repeat protein [Aspergillus mulundensis]